MEITEAEQLRYLTEYSIVSGVPVDTLYALFLVLGKDLYLVLDLLQGQTIKFPKLKALKKNFSSGIRVLELRAQRYKVGDIWKPTIELDIGDIIEIGTKEIAIVMPVQEVLGHYYTILVE